MAISKYHQDGDFSAAEQIAVSGTSAFIQHVTLDNGTGTIIGVAANPLVVTAANSTGTTQVVGNVAHDAVDSGNPVKIGGYAASSFPTAVSAGDRVNAWLSLNGATIVSSALANTVASFEGVTTVSSFVGPTGATAVLATLGASYNGTSMSPNRIPNATTRLVSSAASNNATLVNGAKTFGFMINGYNTTAGVIYLKFYNKATAPTVGTDTPVLTYALAPTSVFEFNMASRYFSTGCGFGLVTGSADADNTGVGAGDIVGLNITYSA